MDIKLKTSPTTEAILLEKKGQWNAVNNKTTGPCKNRQIQHSWTYQRHHAFKQTNHPFKIGKLSFVVVVKRNVIPNIIICSPVESITHAVLFLEGLGGVCVCVCVPVSSHDHSAAQVQPPLTGPFISGQFYLKFVKLQKV